METNQIGNILQILRKRQNISQNQLSKGLCSVPHLSRVESGERVPDMLLLETLFQRLGKSPDKIEMMLSERDYLLYGLRMQIELALLRKDYKLAEMEINFYEEEKESASPLNKQYLYEMKAVIEKDWKGDLEKSREFIKKALELTIPEFSSDMIENYLLSVREIQLILLLAENLMNEDQQEAIFIMEKLEQYVEIHYTDEEEKVKIYPKVAFSLAKGLYVKENYHAVEKLCKKAMHLLTSSGVTTCLLEIMEIYIDVLEKNGKRKVKLIRKERDSLKDVFEEYNVQIPEGECNIWVENTQREIYLIHELIKKYRKMRGVTQESLTDSVAIEQETLSRIENGKRAPSRKTFEKIKEELGIERTYYMGCISSEEFEMLEIRRSINKFISRRNYAKATDMFIEVRDSIDKESKENRQYILYTETTLNFRMGKISIERALKLYKKALSYTQKEFFDKRIFSGVVTRQETSIINNMAICLHRLGENKQAIDLLKSVLNELESSKVNIVFHSIGVILIFSNLCSFYEEEGYFNESINVCNQAIELSLQCGKGNTIGEFLTTKAFTIERMDSEANSCKNKKACQKYYKQAYFISRLMNYRKTCRVIETHYKKIYKNDITEY